jgi:hypothetical protein
LHAPQSEGQLPQVSVPLQAPSPQQVVNASNASRSCCQCEALTGVRPSSICSNAGSVAGPVERLQSSWTACRISSMWRRRMSVWPAVMDSIQFTGLRPQRRRRRSISVRSSSMWTFLMEVSAWRGSSDH